MSDSNNNLSKFVTTELQSPKLPQYHSSSSNCLYFNPLAKKSNLTTNFRNSSDPRNNNFANSLNVFLTPLQLFLQLDEKGWEKVVKNREELENTIQDLDVKLNRVLAK